MSSSSGHKALKAAIKDLTFAPAYYLYGEDDYLKGESLRKLVDAAADPATRDFNLESLRGSDTNAEQLGSILATPPMMADRRVVVVRDVNALKKDARATLDRYLTRPASDLVLVLVSPTGVKCDTHLTSTATGVEFEPLRGDHIPAWIEAYTKTTLGSEITPQAITHLQESVGTDLAQLRTELDKLASFSGTRGIDEAAVAAVVGVRPGETVGALLDATARRDARLALSLLPGVMQQPKVSGVTMVMALSSQMLGIGWARAARDRGLSASRMNGELFGLLKQSGSVYLGRAWGEAVNAWVRSYERWSVGDIDVALEALLDADAALKDTRISSEEQVVTDLILALCGAGAGAPRYAA